MTRVVQRLFELGLTLPRPAAALGAYVPAIIVGELCFTSGQLPLVDGIVMHPGTVGSDVDVAAAKAAAQVAALNALGAAAAAVGGIEAIGGVIKVTGFVQSASGFHQEPAVVNGASELFEALFGERGRHARSAVGVRSLPANAPVEIECVFHLQEGSRG
jgi:enamine deaminase RidA (YjgF/YER057c/UK114 family)